MVGVSDLSDNGEMQRRYCGGKYAYGGGRSIIEDPGKGNRWSIALNLPNKAFKSDSATRASFASLTVWHASRHALTRR
ncbi:hypothetical protein QT15_17060 [Pseudoalteromonas flavipulchra NCIMB 2033 = ATCC BAA-314]|nr:hypothetical protein QT15_17060 [Pseudoalteromonas flavipulchra NCIMB 2033 = ATCC BAA-314]MBE0372848.1 hypothetical protein [Pseudoalteromonas flavipulchra NCIMB 2033 = ATCC BAA-314]